MVFWPTASNIQQVRTCRPLYEQHQATAHAVTLDSAWTKATADIYPGMVMTHLGGDVVTLTDGGATHTSFGLSAHFITSDIDEVIATDASGDRFMSVWRGGPDAVFEIKAPAFFVDATQDFDAAVTTLASGAEVLLVPGKGTLNRGKLCITGADATSTKEVDASADSVAKLLAFPDAGTIIVQLLV